ncbi:MAG: MBL fold metallo-hydrolase [Spirochaetes bacterium]|nr:MBL fold metallo-hydrolase [Spirochaetota bacterium]
MQIKLWGVRGSLPAPISNEEYNRKVQSILERAVQAGITRTSQITEFMETLPEDLKHVFGGNTTCVTVTSSSGKTYILDCGSGVRQLGYELMKGPAARGQGIINIFLTHNHWDHIQGLPFFTPIYIKGNILNFYSPYKDQHKILCEQMSAPFFPAPFDKTESTKKYIYLDPKKRAPIQMENDLVVDFFPLKHPGGSFAYRFKQGGKTFIFATDAEFTGEIFEKGHDNTYDFFQNTDLLIIDSQYTLDESFIKFDWGHTSFTMAVNCGLRWKVKELVMTHHEPAYTDAKLYENYQAAIEHGENCKNETTKIYIATEGMTFNL